MPSNVPSHVRLRKSADDKLTLAVLLYIHGYLSRNELTSIAKDVVEDAWYLDWD